MTKAEFIEQCSKEINDRVSRERYVTRSKLFDMLGFPNNQVDGYWDEDGYHDGYPEVEVLIDERFE